MRIRNHVNPLRYVGLRYEEVALPPAGEVEVELGCADAQFLFQRAPSLPDVAFVGVEIRRELVTDVNARARAAGLANLSAVHANITTDLDRLFPDGRLARVCINFPDPWFKRRHHKRRLVTPELAATVAKKLAPRGMLLFQSDVFDLALDALAVFEDEPALRNRGGAWSFWKGPHGLGARTLREDRCEARGLAIWKMVYDRAA